MTLDLTIAIPVRNDTNHLLHLLASLAALDIARQVIIADDGSDPAVEASALADATSFPTERLTVLRLDSSRGAGAARNLALRAVRTRHLLFLDADDRPTRELRSLCAGLAHAGEFDFCIFQHHDSRLDKDRLFGQMPFDQAFWEAADLARGALRRSLAKPRQSWCKPQTTPGTRSTGRNSCTAEASPAPRFRCITTSSCTG